MANIFLVSYILLLFWQNNNKSAKYEKLWKFLLYLWLIYSTGNINKPMKAFVPPGEFYKDLDMTWQASIHIHQN